MNYTDYIKTDFKSSEKDFLLLKKNKYNSFIINVPMRYNQNVSEFLKDENSFLPKNNLTLNLKSHIINLWFIFKMEIRVVLEKLIDKTLNADDYNYLANYCKHSISKNLLDNNEFEDIFHDFIIENIYNKINKWRALLEIEHLSAYFIKSFENYIKKSGKKCSIKLFQQSEYETKEFTKANDSPIGILPFIRKTLTVKKRIILFLKLFWYLGNIFNNEELTFISKQSGKNPQEIESWLLKQSEKLAQVVLHNEEINVTKTKRIEKIEYLESKYKEKNDPKILEKIKKQNQMLTNGEKRKSHELRSKSISNLLNLTVSDVNTTYSRCIEEVKKNSGLLK